MYRVFILVLAGVFVLSPPLVFAKNNFAAKKNKPIAIQAPKTTLQVGERFEFEVFWMGISIGIGTLEVKEKTVLRGRECFRLVAVAGTNEFLSKIYPVRDEIESFIAADDLSTLQFSKKVSEGRYQAHEIMVYDYEAKKVFYESFKNGSRKEFELTGPVQDFLSLFYWFRLQAVKAGQILRTKLNDEDKDWDVEIQVLRTEHKELRGKRVVESFVIEPKTSYKGIFEQRGRAWVWFSADSSRIPIQISMTTPFGPVSAILHE